MTGIVRRFVAVVVVRCSVKDWAGATAACVKRQSPYLPLGGFASALSVTWLDSRAGQPASLWNFLSA